MKEYKVITMGDSYINVFDQKTEAEAVNLFTKLCDGEKEWRNKYEFAVKTKIYLIRERLIIAKYE